MKKIYKEIYEELNLEDLKTNEKRAIELARGYIGKQTNIWHINSPKKVSTALYVERLDKFFLGQNIGISKVTGTLCAERAAIANMVSNFPYIELNDLKVLAIVSEKNPILPCGVCCEWLYKMNPDMILLTLNEKSTKVIKILLRDYYGDERLLINRRVMVDDYSY